MVRLTTWNVPSIDATTAVDAFTCAEENAMQSVSLFDASCILMYEGFVSIRPSVESTVCRDSS
jgi:hypothetical protein